MRFSIATSLALAGFALIQSTQATVLRGISVPSTLTPGETFNVTFQFQDTSSNAEVYQAIFGLSDSPSEFQNSSTAIGSEPFATFDLSKAELIRGPSGNDSYQAQITLPDAEYFKQYSVKGRFPNPWLISSANIEQVGASGGVTLDVFHAETTINLS